MSRVHKKFSSPIRHSVWVPLGVDEDLVDNDELLSAVVDLNVMIPENHTKRPGAAKIFFKEPNKLYEQVRLVL